MRHKNQIKDDLSFKVTQSLMLSISSSNPFVFSGNLACGRNRTLHVSHTVFTEMLKKGLGI